jgi:hypothetical protein
MLKRLFGSIFSSSITYFSLSFLSQEIKTISYEKLEPIETEQKPIEKIEIDDNYLSQGPINQEENDTIIYEEEFDLLKPGFANDLEMSICL